MFQPIITGPQRFRHSVATEMPSRVLVARVLWIPVTTTLTGRSASYGCRRAIENDRLIILPALTNCDEAKIGWMNPNP